MRNYMRKNYYYPPKFENLPALGADEEYGDIEFTSIEEEYDEGLDLIDLSDRFIVIWVDPRSSVQRKGSLEYNGKRVFDTIEEAQAAIRADSREEIEGNPNGKMTWWIYNLNEENL